MKKLILVILLCGLNANAGGGDVVFDAKKRPEVLSNLLESLQNPGLVCFVKDTASHGMPSSLLGANFDTMSNYIEQMRFEKEKKIIRVFTSTSFAGNREEWIFALSKDLNSVIELAVYQEVIEEQVQTVLAKPKKKTSSQLYIHCR